MADHSCTAFSCILSSSGLKIVSYVEQAPAVISYMRWCKEVVCFLPFLVAANLLFSVLGVTGKVAKDRTENEQVLGM